MKKLIVLGALFALIALAAPPVAAAFPASAASPTPAAAATATGGDPLPFAATPEIEAMGREIYGRWRMPGERVEKIIQQIFWEKDGLGFQYRSHPTLTAAEAFEQRRGNCLSLVNLFVAIARAAELRVYFVEVEDFETFYRYEGTVVRSTHVVGGVITEGAMRTVDFLPDREKRYHKLRVIDDAQAVAHYYNAVGAEAMLAGDMERAEALFQKSIAAAPRFVGVWNNYGILLKRTGRLDEGIAALERALAIDPGFLPAMENLTGYYRLAASPDKSKQMAHRALEQKSRNPYYLSSQALAALMRGETDEAEKLLRRARRIDRTIPEIHLLLGRLELARNHPAKAERMFEKARKMSSQYPDVFQAELDSKIRRLVIASRN
jgi:tetratricopeptide (TPR) repeat protein